MTKASGWPNRLRTADPTDGNRVFPTPMSGILHPAAADFAYSQVSCGKSLVMRHLLHACSTGAHQVVGRAYRVGFLLLLTEMVPGNMLSCLLPIICDKDQRRTPSLPKLA